MEVVHRVMCQTQNLHTQKVKVQILNLPTNNFSIPVIHAFTCSLQNTSILLSIVVVFSNGIAIKNGFTEFSRSSRLFKTNVHL